MVLSQFVQHLLLVNACWTHIIHTHTLHPQCHPVNSHQLPFSSLCTRGKLIEKKCWHATPVKRIGRLVGRLVGMSVSLCTFLHADHNYVSCELQNHIWLHECTRQTVIQWSRSLMIYNTRLTTTTSCSSSSSAKEAYEKKRTKELCVRFLWKPTGPEKNWCKHLNVFV